MLGFLSTIPAYTFQPVAYISPNHIFNVSLCNLLYLINFWHCTSFGPWHKQIGSLHRSLDAGPDQQDLPEEGALQNCGLWCTVSSSTEVVYVAVSVCLNTCFWNCPGKFKYVGRPSPEHFSLHHMKGHSCGAAEDTSSCRPWSWSLEALWPPKGAQVEKGEKWTFSLSWLPETKGQR